VKVFNDNQSVIHSNRNPSYQSNTKHISIKYHFIRQVIDEGGVALENVHTQEYCGNKITKPILLENLRWFLDSLGLQKR
jgi:hypothetical protein